MRIFVSTVIAFAILVPKVGEAKSKPVLHFDCNGTMQLHDVLENMGQWEFMPDNAKFKWVKNYFVNSYLNALDIENKAESDSYLTEMATCLRDRLLPSQQRTELACSGQNLLPQIALAPKTKSSEAAEKEKGGHANPVVEVACIAGSIGGAWSLTETLIAKIGIGGATIASTTATATLAVISAALTGYLTGQGILAIDEHTGGHVVKVTDYFSEGLVHRIMKVPLKKDLKRLEADQLALMTIANYTRTRFRQDCVPQSQ